MLCCLFCCLCFKKCLCCLLYVLCMLLSCATTYTHVSIVVKPSLWSVSLMSPVSVLCLLCSRPVDCNLSVCMCCSVVCVYDGLEHNHLLIISYSLFIVLFLLLCCNDVITNDIVVLVFVMLVCV